MELDYRQRKTAPILPLVNLSPLLTEAVLKGDHLPTLTVTELTTDVSMVWDRQNLPK